MNFKAIALVVGLATLLCPRAQGAVTDTHIWTQALVQGKLSENFRYFIEAQPRFDKNVTRINVLMVRPAIGYALDPTSTVWLGYLWNKTLHDSYSAEHRIWQQFSKEWHYPSIDIYSRTRLEERFFPNADGGIAVRLRQMARILFPLNDDKRWSIATFEEVFVNFNRVTNGPPPGFDQNRAFLGVSYKPSSLLRIEPGYLLQYVNNEGSREDQINHAFFVMFAFTP